MDDATASVKALLARAHRPAHLSQKTLDEHFELFCLVMERGFAIHTGSSHRLVVEYRLSDTGNSRQLPRIQPKAGTHFKLPESWLMPSDHFLYYDPSDDTDFPQLATFDTSHNEFIQADWEDLVDLNKLHSKQVLPLAKLKSLRGLHYVKDIACLQLFELNFDRLFERDVMLAEQLRNLLADKMARHVEASRHWLKASRSEQIALKYLARKKT
ncbi:hypothetical protein L1F30_13560 [Simiduia sp. 21SJ11W-1]|uniref:hypothetical protein n=1 Tax=Simiduia sp. 21SJ11W-1 TaxID=2909669 RepID=UPI00209CF516|nr:hypothetical protein [Simiduia sp. 21SJ11W-1]UTA47183.1 hypothetical protein L1F30_13560 [Simiduia sp. 21SJ11W-1]